VTPLRRQEGFTFVEILITLVFLSVAFLAVTSQFPMGLSVSETAEDLTIEVNLAQELMEEIRTLAWQEYPGAPMGPDAGETSRDWYDDIDDYHGLSEQPPVDLAGVPMDGTGGTPNFSQYRRSVSVAYVDTTTLLDTGGVVTPFKKVTVTVTNTTRRLPHSSSLQLILAWSP